MQLANWSLFQPSIQRYREFRNKIAFSGADSDAAAKAATVALKIMGMTTLGIMGMMMLGSRYIFTDRSIPRSTIVGFELTGAFLLSFPVRSIFKTLQAQKINYHNLNYKEIYTSGCDLALGGLGGLLAGCLGKKYLVLDGSSTWDQRSVVIVNGLSFVVVTGLMALILTAAERSLFKKSSTPKANLPIPPSQAPCVQSNISSASFLRSLQSLSDEEKLTKLMNAISGGLLDYVRAFIAIEGPNQVHNNELALTAALYSFF